MSFSLGRTLKEYSKLGCSQNTYATYALALPFRYRHMTIYHSFKVIPESSSFYWYTKVWIAAI